MLETQISLFKKIGWNSLINKIGNVFLNTSISLAAQVMACNIKTFGLLQCYIATHGFFGPGLVFSSFSYFSIISWTLCKFSAGSQELSAVSSKFSHFTKYSVFPFFVVRFSRIVSTSKLSSSSESSSLERKCMVNRF